MRRTWAGPRSAARFARGLGLPVAAGEQGAHLGYERCDISGLVGRDRCRGSAGRLIYDDEIATGGSVFELSQASWCEQGIQEIWVACTHGVFVHGGLEKLATSRRSPRSSPPDTVYIPPQKRDPKLHFFSVAPVFADAIRRNFLRESIGDLFIYGDETPGKK